MADKPVVFSQADVARIRKMLLAYESGHFAPTQTGSSGGTTTPQIVWFKVSSAIDVGKYWMTLLTPSTTDISTTGPVTAADFGNDATSGSFQYLGINSVEIGQTEAALGTGDIVCGTIHRVQTGSVIVVKIESVGGYQCEAEA